MKPQRARASWRLALLSLLCVGYAAFCLFRMPADPIRPPDAAAYLGFSPIRTLGYPVFLRVFGQKGAVVTQTLLFALALWYLSVETLRLTSSVLLSAGVIVVSILTPDLIEYHTSILTESLFMAGLLVLLALMIRFVREPSSATAALASTIAGLTATLRPTGSAFLPVLVVMVLLQWRRLPGRRLVALAAATAPLLAVVAGERIAARALHGEKLTNLMGRHLFAKAGLIEAPPPSVPSPDPLRARLNDHLTIAYAPIRDIIRRAPRDLRGTLTLYYEACLQNSCVPELGTTVPGSEDWRLDEVLREVGTQRLVRAPLNYAAQAATDYRGLWTVYKQRDPTTVPRLNAFIASRRPLPFEREAFAVNREDTLTFQPSEPVRFIQPIVIAMGWFTGGFALLGLAAAAGGRQLPQTLAVASLASLTAHAALIFSALFAAGVSRFMIGVWPTIMTAVLFGAWWILSATAQFARTRNRSAAG